MKLQETTGHHRQIFAVDGKCMHNKTWLGVIVHVNEIVAGIKPHMVSRKYVQMASVTAGLIAVKAKTHICDETVHFKSDCFRHVLLLDVLCHISTVGHVRPTDAREAFLHVLHLPSDEVVQANRGA